MLVMSVISDMFVSICIAFYNEFFYVLFVASLRPSWPGSHYCYSFVFIVVGLIKCNIALSQIFYVRLLKMLRTQINLQ